MTILVTGGTGQVGTELVAKLLAQRAPLRVLVRQPGRALPPGAQPAPGDLRDAASLDSAMAGAEALFLLTPLSETETQEGLNAVAAARRAGIRRIVYLGIHRIEEGRHIPHFASKLPVIDAIRASGLNWTLIEPNNFFQNDLGMADAILRHGVYPQPIGGIGLSRVDVRDIAEAATVALLQEGHAGQRYPLVGPEILTGEAVAAAYARALGRPVAYGGDDLDAWDAALRDVLPGWLLHDLRIMYEFFQSRGLAATPEELAACTAILGHPPRALDSFIGEVFHRATKA
jgi:uncharacterized protein YbjT (DUF2867 family)